MCIIVMILTFACRTELPSIWTEGVQTTTSGSRVQPVNEIIYPGVSRNRYVGSTEKHCQWVNEGRNTNVSISESVNQQNISNSVFFRPSIVRLEIIIINNVCIIQPLIQLQLAAS